MVRFEWDESKNRANIVKHGIGFDEARRIFSDPYLIIREDRVVEGEERLHAIGSIGPIVLVVHTLREKGLDSIIRIISARKATPAERKLYEESEW